MSTAIENLRRIARRDVIDHIVIFDLYVTVGRDIEYLAIKYGMEPNDIMNLLEGYGETVIVDGAYDKSGKGRLPKLSKLLVEEYIKKFYPGISSENPQNDWICIEAYLDRFHPGWAHQTGEEKVGWRKMR